MGLWEWVVVGGVALLLKKSASDAAEEREREEREQREFEKELKKAEAKRKKAEKQIKKELKKERKKKRNSSGPTPNGRSNASTQSNFDSIQTHENWRYDWQRRSAVTKKRENTPCLFADGITATEFEGIAQKVGNQLNRVKSVNVRGAEVFCTCESQTGQTSWDFSVNFNNWGHITGTRWTWSENPDSNMPQHFGKMMSAEIRNLLAERGICLIDLSDAVDENTSLETPEGVVFCNKIGFFKKLFYGEPNAILSYKPQQLIGEHLYPVVSLLKQCGFTNVKSVPVKDIGCDSTNYLFEVAQISIDGNDELLLGDTFKQSCEVIITYHEKMEIVIPYSSGHYKKRNYIEVGDELQALGFSEIYERPIKDLTTGWLKKDGSVERIIIAGEEDVIKHSVYLFDAEVVIEYHTFKK